MADLANLIDKRHKEYLTDIAYKEYLTDTANLYIRSTPTYITTKQLDNCKIDLLQLRAESVVTDSRTTNTIYQLVPSYHITTGTASATKLYCDIDSVTITPTNALSDWYINGVRIPSSPVVRPISERIREIIRDRQAPRLLVRHAPLAVPRDDREIRARETMRAVVGEVEWRRFVAKGFVSVRAKSGLVYQIFPGHKFTKVFERGQEIEQLCVIMKGDFPPTDEAIMRFLLVTNNEEQFRSLANKQPRTEARMVKMSMPDRSLVDIVAEMRKVA